MNKQCIVFGMIILVVFILFAIYHSIYGESFINRDQSNRHYRPTPNNQTLLKSNDYDSIDSQNTLSDNVIYNDGNGIIKNTDKTLIIDQNVTNFDQNTPESDEYIRKKFVTRNQNRTTKYKDIDYKEGKRGGSSEDLFQYMDQSNDLIQTGYSYSNNFTGNTEGSNEYAPYAPETTKFNKYDTSVMFDNEELLPKEESINPDWWDTVPEAISVKNRHLINVAKPIGINTIGTSLKNPSYDLRGAPPNPKFVVSPWNNSTIEPDTNFKSLCM